MSFIRHISLAAAFVLGGFLAVAPAQAAGEDLEAQVLSILRAHPEVVLEVIKNNPVEVLGALQQGSDSHRRSTLYAQWEQDLKTPKKVAVEGRPVGGPEKAPITIIAFSDFVCQYCHSGAYTIGNLMKKYPGMIRLIFKQVPKTEAGRVAGYWFLAAYRLDKVKAWKMYALAFDRQDKVEADAAGTMRAIAKECGFNVETLEGEVNMNSKAFSVMMDQDAADARNLGLVGTPYYLVNDIIVRGAIPFENFSEAIDLALKHAVK
jgi:protein-disulfide isomerase